MTIRMVSTALILLLRGVKTLICVISLGAAVGFYFIYNIIKIIFIHPDALRNLIGIVFSKITSLRGKRRLLFLVFNIVLT